MAGSYTFDVEAALRSEKGRVVESVHLPSNNRDGRRPLVDACPQGTDKNDRLLHGG